MGVRQVSRRKFGLNGFFPSLKMGRLLWFESYLERDFMILLDFDPDVEAFYEQPLTINYQANGRAYKYTPDFRVVRGQRTALIECKPKARVDTPENSRKFRAAQDFCAQAHWDFFVVTDEELRRGFRLPNIKLLTRYARLEGPSCIPWPLQTALDRESGLTLEQAAQIIAPNAPLAGIPAILHLVFHHCLVISLDEQPITPSSLLQLPHSSTRGRSLP
jgi:hypothetical protein